MSICRIEILGVPVDNVSMQQSLDLVEELISEGGSHSIIAVNPEKVIKAQQDPYLAKRLASARLLIPDGIGVVLAARILGLAKMKRVAGAELMPEICGLANDNGYRIFLFGASPEVNQKARENLEIRYPDIQIVGNRDGFLKEEDMPSLVQQINETEAQILFIALGSPKQELWMEKYLPQLNVNVCQGVGGTFDVISGNVRRAPYIFRKLHLEWMYRLLANPKRILRQTALPKFVYQVVMRKVNRGGM